MALPLGAQGFPTLAEHSIVVLPDCSTYGGRTGRDYVEVMHELIHLYLGRSVAACAETFEQLRSRLASGYPAPYHPTVRPEFQAQPPKPKKRPLPSGDVPTTADRTIQPRVSSFAAVNDPNEPSAFLSATPSTGEPPNKKKRGRPSKADYEIRAAEAAARGEPYPPPKKPRTPRPSAEGAASTANKFTPVASGLAGVEESSTGKKQVRPKKKKQAAARSTSLEITAQAADQMQPEIGGFTGSIVPETQTATQPAPENLMIELQEHAALSEHDRPVESEAMEVDPREGGRASERQEELHHGHRHEEEQGQHPEQRLGPDFRAYDTHQRTPTT